jgi:C-terminal processing protease CtpA/Prc
MLKDEEVVRKAGVVIGDVVLKVDGEDVEARTKRLSKYLVTSTPWHQVHLIITSTLLNGPDRSTAILTLRDAANHVKQVQLARTRAAMQRTSNNPIQEATRILPGNIGYVDLRRLSIADVDDMFEHMKDTGGIIFDIRGYPQGTAWAIAPRINTRGAQFGSMILASTIGLRADVEEGWYSFMQPLPRTDKWKYGGKTVALINERTISQAEHTGLFFEAANGMKFIGSKSAGADGDVTQFFLPGRVTVHFGGHDIRHIDGRQLQRIGLIPDIEVHPTIAGIRAGKDEVLDRALEYLRQEAASHSSH